MTPAPLAPAVAFAVLLPALLVSHNVADHWGQTHRQATRKHLAGWPGRRACAAHVATYTMLTAGTVAGLWWLLDLSVTTAGFVAGQLVSAVTHYIADRRRPLERLVNSALFRRIGKGDFYRLGQPRPALIARADNGVVVRLFHPARMADGVQEPWDNPSLGTGAYALDQSWHWLWLFVAALLTALL